MRRPLCIYWLSAMICWSGCSVAAGRQRPSAEFSIDVAKVDDDIHQDFRALAESGSVVTEVDYTSYNYGYRNPSKDPKSTPSEIRRFESPPPSSRFRCIVDYLGGRMHVRLDRIQIDSRHKDRSFAKHQDAWYDVDHVALGDGQTVSEKNYNMTSSALIGADDVIIPHPPWLEKYFLHSPVRSSGLKTTPWHLATTEDIQILTLEQSAEERYFVKTWLGATPKEAGRSPYREDEVLLFRPGGEFPERPFERSRYIRGDLLERKTLQWQMKQSREGLRPFLKTFILEQYLVGDRSKSLNERLSRKISLNFAKADFVTPVDEAILKAPAFDLSKVTVVLKQDNVDPRTRLAGGEEFFRSSSSHPENKVTSVRLAFVGLAVGIVLMAIWARLKFSRSSQ